MPMQSERWRNARPKAGNTTLKTELPLALQTAIANEDLAALRQFIGNQLGQIASLTPTDRQRLERLFALCLLVTFEKS